MPRELLGSSAPYHLFKGRPPLRTQFGRYERGLTHLPAKDGRIAIDIFRRGPASLWCAPEQQTKLKSKRLQLGSGIAQNVAGITTGMFHQIFLMIFLSRIELPGS